MKLGTTSILRNTLGAVASRAGFVGSLSLTPAPNRPTLFQPVGLWADWAMAPVYTPALAGQVFSVLDYGADNTNTHNATQSIRDTFAAAKTWQASNANGLVTVYFPAGTYVVWRDTSDSEDFIFTLHQDNLVIEGEDPATTSLNVRATGGADPNTFIENRGILFCTRGTPTPLDGITIRGLRMTGNAPANLYAGRYTGTQGVSDPAPGLPWGTVGWDVNHKPVGIWDDVTNVIVEDCELDNWRGEGVYAGGGLELGNMTVRRCLIYSNNASAVSMGGFVTVDDCEIYDCYNGLECFMLGGVQSLTVTDSIIDPNRSGTVTGSFGVAYLGYAASALTVTGNQIGKCNAGVLLAEMASNVIIDNNDFTDCTAVYGIYQESYTGDMSVDQSELNRWEHIDVTNNTLTALTRDVGAFMLMFTNTGLDWTVTGNTVIDTGSNTVAEFIETPSGASGGFAVSGNTMGESRPVKPYDGPRPVWGSNTVTGYFANGTEYNSGTGGLDPAPVTFYPPWRKMRVSDMGTGTLTHVYQVDSYELANFPTGFVLEMRRNGSNAEFTGIEVIPDPSWNSLARGYMLYEGAVLTLTKGAGGLFDFTSYTAPTTAADTITDTNPTYATGKAINVLGRGSVTLSPAVSHVFSGHAGVAIGETITINHNAVTTIDHLVGNVEISTGSDFVASGSGSLSATRHQDGTLLVGTHTVTEDAPIIGLLQTGNNQDNVYGMDVILVQDGANPSAVDGYYAIERKEGAGSWAEIVQVPKASVTGTRKTYTYTDPDLDHLDRGVAFSYRARAVSPGTPDVVSRWSNTANKTFTDYVGTLDVRTEIYKTASGQDLEMDIHRPNNALTGRTAVICVHGGGWTSSSRAVHTAHCVHFAAQGFVAFNIDYRLDDGTDDMEDQVRDVRAAVRWVRENATEYGVDPDDIVVLGESAGGHLAGCAAFIDAFDDSGGNQAVSSRPDRAVLINPITYLPGIPWYEGNAAQVGATPVPDDTTQLTPASTGADLSLRLSPQLYANITPAPPVLFIHGDADSVVPFAQSEDMHDLLVLAGNTSTLETMVGSDHSFFLPGVGTTAEINATLALIDAFLTP